MKKLTPLLLLFFTVYAYAGTITTNVSSLFNFKDCYLHHSTTPQWFLINATGLSANLIVTAPEHFEVSTDLNKFYSGTLTIAQGGGNLTNTKIFVRFTPSSTGSKSGSISLTNIGSTTKSVGVSGTGINFPSLSNYYATINTQTGATLKTALYDKIKGHSSVGYNGLYNHYPTTDTYYDGTVWDIYSTRVDAPSPYTYNHGAKKCGNYQVEGDCYNREHTVPQSWFNSSEPTQSDMFHVLPTDGKVNGLRSNFPFGEVSNPTQTSLQGAKLGPNTTSGYSSTVFEPIDEYKGDIARGLLYMVTRYENSVSTWSGTAVLDGSVFPAYKQWHLNLLLKWHNQDPPSNREIIRNNAIANGIQNNRNPFIDSPQFAHRIWGGAIPGEPGSTIATNIQISNYNGTSLTLNFRSGEGQRRLIIVRPVTANATHPIDGKHYQASNTLSTSATISPDNFVVYNGTGSSVNILGLTNGVNYTIRVYEYNGWYSTSNYRTSTVGSINTAPLDVEFGTFTAAKQADKRIVLDWTTLRENNNQRFEIERSFTNQPFLKIGEVASKGNSNLTQSYTFNDDTLKTGVAASITTITYRIKQISTNGDFTYSSFQVVDAKPTAADTVVYESFKLRLSGRAVVVDWQTSRENNNNRFEVLKGTTANSLSSIKNVPSLGNSNVPQNYTYTDTATSASQTWFYQIKYVLNNNAVGFSTVQQINIPVVQPNDTVIFANFSLTNQTNGVLVNWQTSKEQNNKDFEVQRGLTANNFTTLAIISSNNSLTYNYPDESVVANTRYYYRIKYTSFNGLTGYSEVKNILTPLAPPPPKDTVHFKSIGGSIDTDRTVSLAWLTSIEGKIGKHEVLRKIDNKPFTVIGELIGNVHQDTSGVLYSFEDDYFTQPQNKYNTVIYLIRYTGANPSYLVNSDELKFVNVGLNKQVPQPFEGNIYPMPFDKTLNITLPQSDNELWHLSINNLLGEEVYHGDASSTQGRLTLNNLEHLNKGIYLLSLRNKNEVWHVRIIKQ
ncbi:MAG: T9SS C-terminal target domain-containing protein [Bacteroidetes bacterium]|nr:MAG: T9SS C-terminal target domain-containing protein [Bacteroidota bacterium]